MSKTTALAADVCGAAARLSQAMAARNALLSAAAAGKAVSAQELRQAEQTVRDCELDATLAAEIGKHTRGQQDLALIDQRASEAAAIRQRKAELVQEHIRAAVALDAAMAAAREAASRLRDVCAALETADLAAHQHNALLEADARTNAALAARHRSLWPKAMVAGPLPLSFGTPLRPELVALRQAGPVQTSLRDVVEPRTAETIARASHRLPAAADLAAA
jgi:hypothetical protein